MSDADDNGDDGGSRLILPGPKPTFRRTTRRETNIGGVKISYVVDTDIFDGVPPEAFIAQGPRGEGFNLKLLSDKLNEHEQYIQALIREIVTLRNLVQCAVDGVGTGLLES